MDYEEEPEQEADAGATKGPGDVKKGYVGRLPNFRAPWNLCLGPCNRLLQNHSGYPNAFVVCLAQ